MDASVALVLAVKWKQTLLVPWDPLPKEDCCFGSKICTYKVVGVILTLVQKIFRKYAINTKCTLF